MAYESQVLRDARIDLGAIVGAVVTRLPRIIVVTLLLLAATFALLMFVPKMYESSAGILVEPRSNVYTRAANEAAPTPSDAAGVISSQIELIKSRDTLLNVVDQLDLRSVPEFNGSAAGPSPLGIISQFLGRKPAPANIDETVLNNLLDRMSVIQERDSAIITVLVRSTDSDLAARIANAVANAHVARRTDLSLSDTAEASGWLGDEIAKLRVSVTTAEDAVANFKVEHDLFTGANNTSLADQELSGIAAQITEAQERKSAALSRASLIRGLIDRGAPIDGIADVRASAVIQQLTQQKAQLQGERAQKSATLLPNHPTILALTAQIDELNNQINLEGRRVAEGLESEGEIEANLETSLRAELTRSKGSASTATTNTVTLDSLEREAKAQRDLLESYLQRYSEARSRTESNSALPDVRVVTIAAASVVPASPKTALILLAVGIVSTLGQLGLVIFSELMSGRAIIAGRQRYEDAPVERPQDELDEVPFVEAELEPDQRWEPVPPVATAVHAEPEDLPAVLEAEPEFEPELEPAVAWAEDELAMTEPEDAYFDAPPAFEAPAELAAEAIEPLPEPVAIPPEPVAAPVATIEDEERARFLKSMLADHGMDAEQVLHTAEVEAVSEHNDWAEEPAPSATDHMQPQSARMAFADLSSDLALGRTRLVVLAGHRSNLECEVLAEALCADALDKGLSVALIDAGSERPSADAGLSDLSTGVASFGDVVHKSTDNAFAEVPWGQGRSIDDRSGKPLTLVEALSDIYEVVVLMTGHVGATSTLPMFAGLDGRLVLVASDHDDLGAVESMRDQLAEAGYGSAEVITTPELVAA